MKKIFTVILLSLLFGACSEYQKAYKSEDIGVKYEVSKKLYEKGKYTKAIRLFEQIAPSYKGKPQAEELFYMYSESLYKTKQYFLAGYQYSSFASLYPRSPKLEEALFKSAKCEALLSPRYTLDQTDTDKAVSKLQDFIDRYPESAQLSEANALMKDLKEKLEKKAFEIAKQYNTISDFKSAITAFNIFLDEYPGTIYKEDALYYKFDSSYHLAINSVQSKMQERLKDAQDNYTALVKHNAETKYKSKAETMLKNINTQLQQFSK